MKPEIVVVGSLNMDLVGTCHRLPKAGETLTGTGFHTVPGGKGANQAVAAARLGAAVAMIGRVGADPFGARLVENLRRSGVDGSSIGIDEGAPTGVALILVDEGAENAILVIPGANASFSPDDVAAQRDLIVQARAVLLQLEVPLETVLAAAELAHEGGARVILDPSPVRPLPSRLWQLTDILVPNEGEASDLAGREVADLNGARIAAADLLERGARAVVVKLGKDGALVADGQRCDWVKGFPVHPVDTTAAGDAFAGGLAAALARGEGLLAAVSYANAVGALAATRLGAQDSLPSREEVGRFLTGRGTL